MPANPSVLLDAVLRGTVLRTANQPCHGAPHGPPHRVASGRGLGETVAGLGGNRTRVCSIIGENFLYSIKAPAWLHLMGAVSSSDDGWHRL